MIIDKIENASKYTSVVHNLDNALNFIAAYPNLAAGRHDFDGGYLIVCSGNSAAIEEKLFEAHRNYADVMYITQHDETVSYRCTDDLDLCEEYDPAKECAMFSGVEKDIVITVPAGYFYVMLPGEGHKPCVHLTAAKPYIKYIIKCLQ